MGSSRLPSSLESSLGDSSLEEEEEAATTVSSSTTVTVVVVVVVVVVETASTLFFLESSTMTVVDFDLAGDPDRAIVVDFFLVFFFANE